MISSNYHTITAFGTLGPEVQILSSRPNKINRLRRFFGVAYFFEFTHKCVNKLSANIRCLGRGLSSHPLRHPLPYLSILKYTESYFKISRFFIIKQGPKWGRKIVGEFRYFVGIIIDYQKTAVHIIIYVSDQKELYGLL